MFIFCCVMMNYRLLLFLLILPLIALTENVNARKRPLLDHLNPTVHPLMDQIALATNWQTPNRVISATYSRHPETGHVKQANLMVNLLPHQIQRPIVDMAASETLSNSKTASEYVSKALNMRQKYGFKAPHSTYVKYDVYEKERMHHLLPTQLELPARQKYGVTAIPRSSKGYHDYDNKNKKHSGRHHTSLDMDEAYSSQSPYSHEYSSEDRDEIVTYRPHVARSIPPSREMLKHIRQSVIQYMKEKDAEEKLSKMPKIKSILPHEEIKPFIRQPLKEHTDTGSIYHGVKHKIREYADSMNMYNEEYTPEPTIAYKAPTKMTYTTLMPYTVEPYPEHQHIESKTPNIDLTFRSKGRSKPIDLSALEVGQSWNHGASNYDHSAKGYSEYDQIHAMSAHSQRPKLHFNSQTYHDINSLSQFKAKPPSYPEDYLPAPYSNVKVKDHLTNVGTSITVGKHIERDEDSTKDLEHYYRGGIHLINGVPVSNPYNLNMDTLRQLFHTNPENQINDDSNNWKPYHSSSSSNSNSYGTSTNVKENYAPTKTQFSEPFEDIYPTKYTIEDSYDGKYKNTNEWEPLNTSGRRPKGHKSGNGSNKYGGGGGGGGGGGAIDMHASPTSQKTKRIPKSNGTSIRIKGAKIKIKPAKGTKIFSGKKSRDLDTELRPPPYKK